MFRKSVSVEPFQEKRFKKKRFRKKRFNGLQLKKLKRLFPETPFRETRYPETRCPETQYPETQYPVSLDYEIQPEQVAVMRASGEEFTLLDCRESWEYQTAHIEGTKHIPMGDIPAHVQELDPDEHIVVVCHHGVRSMNVTAWLRQQGFEKAQSMAGGIDRWSRTVDPKVPIY